MRSGINPSFTLASNLSPQQSSFYHKNGFLHFKGFLDREQLASIVHAMEELETFWLKSEKKDFYGVPMRFGLTATGEPMVTRYAFANLQHPVFAGLLEDERIKALLPLLGSESRFGTVEKDGMVINHYLNTATSQFSRMGWHTDAVRGFFYGGKPEPMINIGIHLDDFPAEYGGLKVLAGSHHQSSLKLLFHKRYYVDHKTDSREVGFDINAGDLTVHDGRIWHRVAKCKHMGERSRRRVIYVPIIQGPFQPKDEQSKTPFYHKLWRLSR